MQVVIWLLKKIFVKLYNEVKPFDYLNFSTAVLSCYWVPARKLFVAT